MTNVILFDLGGVLVDFTGFTEMIRWMKEPLTEREFADRWLLSPAASKFEQGRSDPAEFAQALIKEFNFNIESGPLIEAFKNFIHGLYPGVTDLLRDLSNDFLIASFSNTNELHWRKLSQETAIDKLLHRNFLSYQTGLVKPHQEAFQHVIDALHCQPQEILYFDDNSMNVEMGNHMGMRSFKVQGFDELRHRLNALNSPANQAVS